MNRDISSRLDELAFGYRDDALDEAVLRVQDSVDVGAHREAQQWLSTVFALVRAAGAGGSH